MKTLRDLTRFNRTVNGFRMGIEIEAEGYFPWEAPENWDAKRDGSLGPDGREFVTRQAFGYERVETMLKRIDKSLQHPTTRLDCSSACSVHIHMNVQDLEIIDIVKIMTLYYIFEDALTDYAGPDRAGNLFCLRASDAERPIHLTIEAINNGRFPHILDERIRYSALNLNALNRFGTLEFRAFGALKKSAMEILPWVRMIAEIREAALGWATPATIVEQFSILGSEEFYKSVFSEDSLGLLKFDIDTMYEGVRRAQWLAYQIDYENLGADPIPVVNLMQGNHGQYDEEARRMIINDMQRRTRPLPLQAEPLEEFPDNGDIEDDNEF